ncbi:P-loop containing nucleoside triphosphate hydrolase protein [Pavlovales sp. CCMP2436]|nr:P-loop containing nucleoside triphosphate hydrolase protein [Pavlovales sp. CCMP2436]|mmetsp:Transcript_47353/g.108952  ORF Transcript_47353/g.108952 Transcript_47353/m.108952 type:complete len:737 (-) Transcript_47353:97-2307(-)
MEGIKDAAVTALGERAGLVDEAVLEYLCGTVEGSLDEGQDDDDIIDAIAGLLDECLSLHDGAAINELCRTIIRGAKASRQGAAASTPASAAPNAAEPMSFKLNDAITAQEKSIKADFKIEMGVRVNFNASLMSRGTNAEISEEDPDMMLRRLKMEKRSAKLDKRAARREKLRAMQNEETMQALTREPVVLHWQGVRKGTSDIILQGVEMRLGALELLSDCTVTIAFGRRYGLIGRNGIGKTTLLKHLSAKKFDGIPQHLQVLHIEQEVPGGDASVLECVLATDVERTALLAEERELQEEHAEEDGEDEQDSATRLNEVWERLKAIESDSAPARAAEILCGLGFSEEDQQRTTASFSGGWRMRVSLARALFISPDVLLLDEPTNHLDLHAVLWLEEYLQSWEKTLIVVSHARSFLNAVVTDILHFQNKDIRRFKGDYDTFEDTRAEELRQSGKKAEAQDRQRAHTQAFIDRFRSNAKRASMVQSRIKSLGRMELLAEVFEDPTLQFDFPSPEPLQPPVLGMTDCSFQYPGDKPNIFTNVNLGIDLETRLAVVGPNGAGKSTLLKVILGDLEPTSGEVHRSGKLRLGRFSQHHVDQLDLSLSALEAFQKADPQASGVEVRRHLGSMGLGGNLALQPMRTLSGGQKSRAAFAQIMWQKPHILLLDEPTNHLDLDAVEALINALNNFEGGLLVVSHDEHLITNVCEQLLVVDDGKVWEHAEGFKAYRKQQLAKSRTLKAK